MTPLSEYIAKLEERCRKRLERWNAKHNADWRLYAVLGGMGWYFYGMIVNSVRLGIRQSMDANSSIMIALRSPQMKEMKADLPKWQVWKMNRIRKKVKK